MAVQDKSEFYPRVLVVAHNPFSDTQNNGKTLSAFFRGYPETKIAQLFLTTDIPDFSICKRFFQLNDFIMTRRFFCGKKVDGFLVDESSLSRVYATKTKVNSSRLLKIIRAANGPTFRCIRDFIWKRANFRTANLMSFVNDFMPEVVFYQSSSGVFAFELVRWICEEWNIPLVMHTTDDYLASRFSINPFFWYLHSRINRLYSWAAGYSRIVFAISEFMVDEYSRKFSGKFDIALNATAPNAIPDYVGGGPSIRILYAGNIGLNRWRVLEKIGKSVDAINKKKKCSARLEIYTLAMTPPRIIKRLSIGQSCFFCGPIDTDALNRAKSKSDIVLHVESFDKKNRNITRLSVSTKIPEYLAAGRCIMAIGPSDIASMKYLASNEVAICVCKKGRRDIESALEKVMFDSELRKKFAKKARDLAIREHDPIKIRESIQAEIKLAAAEKRR